MTDVVQAGSVVVSRVTSLPATWIWLIALLVVHLATNYRAVRAVQMTSLNRQRANIVFSTLFETDDGGWQTTTTPTTTTKERRNQEADDEFRVPRPDEVAAHERIFERDGILRWTSIGSHSSSSSRTLGWCRIGTSLQELVSLLRRNDGSLPALRELTDLFESESYLLFFSSSKRAGSGKAIVVLKHGCTPAHQVKAWAHALLAARVLLLGREEDGPEDERTILSVVEQTLTFLNADARFDRYVTRLARAGWALDVAALETTPGRRIRIS